MRDVSDIPSTLPLPRADSKHRRLRSVAICAAGGIEKYDPQIHQDRHDRCRLLGQSGRQYTWRRNQLRRPAKLASAQSETGEYCPPSYANAAPGAFDTQAGGYAGNPNAPKHLDTRGKAQATAAIAIVSTTILMCSIHRTSAAQSPIRAAIACTIAMDLKCKFQFTTVTGTTNTPSARRYTGAITS